MTLIIDTDAGLDDFLAIQCLLHKKTVLKRCVGCFLPSNKLPWAETVPRPRILFQVGWIITDLAQSTRFLRARGVSNISDPNNLPPSQPSSKALTLVMDLFERSAESSVDILCLGPLTNVVHWLKHCDAFQLIKIRNIWIMGGNQSRKNDRPEQIPEFNFGWDPGAAQALFSMKNIANKIHLVTISVSSREKLLQAVGADCFNEFLAHCEADFLRSLFQVDECGYFLSYDAICAFVSQCPDRVEWDIVPIQVQDNGVVIDHPDAAPIRMARQIDFHSHYLDWISSQVTKKVNR